MSALFHPPQPDTPKPANLAPDVVEVATFPGKYAGTPFDPLVAWQPYRWDIIIWYRGSDEDAPFQIPEADWPAWFRVDPTGALTWARLCKLQGYKFVVENCSKTQLIKLGFKF